MNGSKVNCLHKLLSAGRGQNIDEERTERSASGVQLAE